MSGSQKYFRDYHKSLSVPRKVLYLCLLQLCQVAKYSWHPCYGLNKSHLLLVYGWFIPSLNPMDGFHNNIQSLNMKTILEHFCYDNAVENEAHMVLYCSLNNFHTDIFHQNKYLFEMKKVYVFWHSTWYIGDQKWSFCILVCKGMILLSILMESVMCLQVNMQEEDISYSWAE